jgi:hypothetical protein
VGPVVAIETKTLDGRLSSLQWMCRWNHDGKRGGLVRDPRRGCAGPRCSLAVDDQIASAVQKDRTDVTAVGRGQIARPALGLEIVRAVEAADLLQEYEATTTPW